MYAARVDVMCRFACATYVDSEKGVEPSFSLSWGDSVVACRLCRRRVAAEAAVEGADPLTNRRKFKRRTDSGR